MSDRFGFRSKLPAASGSLCSSSKANEGKKAPAGSKRPIAIISLKTIRIYSKSKFQKTNSNTVSNSNTIYRNFYIQKAFFNQGKFRENLQNNLQKPTKNPTKNLQKPTKPYKNLRVKRASGRYPTKPDVCFRGHL